MPRPCSPRFPKVLWVDAAATLTSGDGTILPPSAGERRRHRSDESKIVRRDFGAEAANLVARLIVMPAHSQRRAGPISRTPPVRIRPDHEIAPLLDHIRLRLHEGWSIARMAAPKHNMSRRTFERRFKQATGQNPGDWLLGERVEAAKDLFAPLIAVNGRNCRGGRLWQRACLATSFQAQGAAVPCSVIAAAFPAHLRTHD